MSARHSEEVWNRHKAAIQTLYLDEDRKLLGVGGVVEQMAELHGFRATKAQYERQFKKWGFGKNRTNKEWELITHQVAKRKRNGKESVVMINGIIVCSKRLKKEMSRNGYATAFPHLEQPKTPPMNSENFHFVFTPPCQNSAPEWPPSLPWFRLVSKYLNGTSTLTSHLPSSSAQLSETLHRVSRSLLSNQNLAHFQDLATSKVASKLTYIMPEESTGQSHELAYSIVRLASSGTSLVPPGTTIASFKVLLYSISNKLDDNSIDSSMIMEFASKLVAAISDQRTVTFDDIRTEPSLVALLEKFQEVACNSSDLEILESLLKFKMSPNRAIRHRESGNLLSPIQIAAIKNDLELATLLLQYNADVDAIGIPKQPTALCIALLNLDGSMCRLLLTSNANLIHQFHSHTFSSHEILRWDPTYNKAFFTLIGPFTPLSLIFSTPWNPIDDNEAYEVYNEITLDAISMEMHAKFLDKALNTAAMRFPNGKIPEPYLEHLIYVASRMLDKHSNIRIALEALILRGGNINTESVHGILPITGNIFANKDFKRLMVFLSLGAEPSLSRTSPYFKTRPALLHCAALRGDVETVCFLLDLGVDSDDHINLRNADHVLYTEILGLSEQFFEFTSTSPDWRKYHTPLQFALASQDFEITKYYYEGKIKVANILLSKGAAISKGDLAAAVRLGDLQLINHLYRLGASVNERSICGWTPLEESTDLGLHDISRYLIDSGAKPTGYEVLLAAKSGSPPEFINFLVSFCGAFNGTYLAEYFANGQEGFISVVLSMGKLDFDPKVLAGAILGMKRMHNRTRLRQFLKEYCKLFSNFEFSENKGIGMATVLAMAAIYDPRDTLCFFTDLFSMPETQVCFSALNSVEEVFSKFNPTVDDDVWLQKFHYRCYTLSPLAMVAIHEFGPLLGTRELLGITKLIDYGFQPDALTMIYAVFRGSRDLLGVLLSNGADPNQRYSKMDSPLQMAIRETTNIDWHEIVQDLLRNGADVNADPPPAPWIQWAPRTALQIAIECGNMELARQLMGMGANVNAAAACHSGATALQIAAGKGFIGLAKMLIEGGADIDAKGAMIRGRTALEIAAEYGRIDMLQFLLDGSPNASTQDEYSLQYIRAIKFAERNGHMAAAMILRNHREWSPEDHSLYEKEALEEEDYSEDGGPFKKPFRDNLDQLGNRLDDIVWENTDTDDGTSSSEYGSGHPEHSEEHSDLVGPHFEGSSEDVALSLGESEDLGNWDEVFGVSESNIEADGAEETGEDLEARWQAFEKGLLEAGIVVDV